MTASEVAPTTQCGKEAGQCRHAPGSLHASSLAGALAARCRIRRHLDGSRLFQLARARARRAPRAPASAFWLRRRRAAWVASARGSRTPLEDAWWHRLGSVWPGRRLNQLLLRIRRIAHDDSEAAEVAQPVVKRAHRVCAAAPFTATRTRCEPSARFRKLARSRPSVDRSRCRLVLQDRRLDALEGCTGAEAHKWRVPSQMRSLLNPPPRSSWLGASSSSASSP